MSALGQKQTSRHLQPMSALPQKRTLELAREMSALFLECAAKGGIQNVRMITRWVVSLSLAAQVQPN